MIRNLSGFSPQSTDGDFIVLTGFICDIGPRPFNDTGACTESVEEATNLQHKLSSEVSDQAESLPSITDLLKQAEAHQEPFSNIVHSIVHFSSQNEFLTGYPEKTEVTYSVGVKKYSSVRRKADRKYNGDSLQVKDILRAQITFPDEGSLICGLYHLTNLASHRNDTNRRDGANRFPRLEIVRLKNLFRTSAVGNTYYEALPTGYRHILVNIRLDDGIIAGKNIQICGFMYSCIID